MILAINNIDIPKEWWHDTTIQNKYGMTVAIILAYKGIIPPKEWEHDKFI